MFLLFEFIPKIQGGKGRMEGRRARIQGGVIFFLRRMWRWKAKKIGKMWSRVPRWIDLLWEHSRTCCNNVNSQRGSRHKRVRLRRLHQFGYRSLLFRDRDVACTRSTNYVYQVAATQPTCSGFHDQIFITWSCNWVTRRVSRLTFIPIVLHWNSVSNRNKYVCT